MGKLLFLTMSNWIFDTRKCLVFSVNPWATSGSSSSIVPFNDLQYSNFTSHIHAFSRNSLVMVLKKKATRNKVDYVPPEGLHSITLRCHCSPNTAKEQCKYLESWVVRLNVAIWLEKVWSILKLSIFVIQLHCRVEFCQ